MKARILFLIFWGLFSFSYGQEQVRFQLLVGEEEVQAGGLIEASLVARIIEGWHLYSTTQAPGGPIPTSISVVENSVFSQAGSVKGPPPLRWFDSNFGIDTEYFEKRVDFRIPVRIDSEAASGAHQLAVKVRFQACSDTLCLAPQNRTLMGTIQVAGRPGSEAGSATATGSSEGIQTVQPQAGMDSAASQKPDTIAQTTDRQSDAPLPAGASAPISTLAYILGAMAMGGLALLTPCVFPMIPITVSYFTKRDASRKQAVSDAALYAVGIILTFTVIGFAMTFLFGAGGINRLAASPVVNVFIAMVFIVFALSLFGTIELRLPSRWINAVDRQSSAAGGVVGILLMAVTFSLTSFTCTVPFVGAVMVAALHGDLLWSMLGVASFATVFAAPFFFLALFPSWLQALPSSGNWMNSVKITMGFLELAAALKFISNIDLVYQWEMLTRPVFITVWLSIALVTTLYLLGKVRFPHESPTDSVGAARVLSAIFFLAVAVYLMRGLFGFPLGELDAFLPPRDYGLSASLAPFSGQGTEREERWLSNYQEALAQAKEQERPVFVDFTGYTCTNCRWMEANIFVLDKVQDLFDQFVLVRLYTDGIELEHEENLRFEQDRFGTIALPLYAVMSPQDEILETFPGLTRNRGEFINFLENGLAWNKGEMPHSQISDLVR